MKKKLILSSLIIILVIIGVFFTLNKINENKRNYEIEDISEFKYFVMKENDKFGVIDATGKIIIQATYDKVEIPNPSKDVFICYKNEKGIAMNSNNQQLFAEYNSIEGIELKNAVNSLNFEKSVLKTEKNGQYGLIDFTGKRILNTEYSSIEGITGIEGELKVQKNEKCGVANIKGTILVKCEYDTVEGDNYFNEDNKHGFIVGNKNENGYNYGYINNKGKLILKLEYNDISRVTDIQTDEGLYFIAAKNGQYGVMKNKKPIVKCENQAIEYDKTNKIFIIQKGKNYGVADIEGKVLIPIENTSIESKGEYIYVEKNNIREVYDKSGNKAKVEYNKIILPTSNENYKIVINSEENSNYYGVIDNNGKEVIKTDYLYIEYAFDNYFISCGKNGKLGVIDSNGKTVIDLKYDLVQKMQGKNFIQTLYSETNTTEIYAEDMKEICKMQNANVETKNDYIKLYSNKEIKYIDNSGKIIASSKLFPDKKIYASSRDDKWGYVDSNGKVVVNYEYELCTELNAYGYAAVKKNGKWGAIDSNGNIVVDPKYELNENYNGINFIGEYVEVNTGFGNTYFTKNI